MKTTKAKGFTLIELIVVIAIIGVLAAILVPTMLGYVTKSRCSSANANAKSLYNAINSALVDLDSEGHDITSYDSVTTIDSSTDATLLAKIENYFSDYKKLDSNSVSISSGTCEGVMITSGAYIGTYPNPSTVDDVAAVAGKTSGCCKTGSQNAATLANAIA